MLRAKDVMRRQVATLPPEATVSEAARRFEAAGISGAPVVDANGRLLGVVSRTDLLRRHEEHGAGRTPAFYLEGETLALAREVQHPGETPVAEVMSGAVLCADEDAPISEVAEFMLERRIHRVMITRAGALVGIVTSMDLLRLLARPRPGRRHASRRSSRRGSRRPARVTRP